MTTFLAVQQATDGLPGWAQVTIALGAFLGIITKQFVPGWFYSEKTAENKELKAENARLVQVVFDTQQKTLPALEAATRAVSDALEEIRVAHRRDQS